MVLLNRRNSRKAKLSTRSTISFVISSVGTRDEFIDRAIIPAILKQGIDSFEIVIAGRYGGTYLSSDHVRYVPVTRFPVYFYKHFQTGVTESRYEWIVDLDDDMVLDDDWYSHLVDGAKEDSDVDVYGFRLLNPDGSIYADIGDVFALLQADHRVRPTSYFGSYIARKAVFEGAPYPTYMSGDRHHGFLLGRKGVKRRFLPAVCVTHYGALGRDGAIARASSERYHSTIELRRRLGLITGTAKADYKDKAMRWYRYAAKLEKTTKRIGIWGWFGHDNAGDELILSSMTAALSHHNISVYTDRPEGVRELHNLEHVFHTANLHKHLDGLDLLLVGGGGVLHNRAISLAFPRRLMERCETPVIVYAAGIPFLEWCSDLYYFLSKCYLVTLRDHLCLSFLKQRFADIPAEFLPDPAFMIPKLQHQTVPGKIVLNIRMIPEGWRQGLPRNVNSMLREELSSIYEYLVKRGYSPVIVGFEPRDEATLSNQGYPYSMVDFRQAVDEIATAELLIGTRYHSGIIAITQQTPAILLNYQRKMEGLKTVVSSGIKLVNIENLNLVREFDAFSQAKSEYKVHEIRALKEMIGEFNRMYVDYVY